MHRLHTPPRSRHRGCSSSLCMTARRRACIAVHFPPFCHSERSEESPGQAHPHRMHHTPLTPPRSHHRGCFAALCMTARRRACFAAFSPLSRHSEPARNPPSRRTSKVKSAALHCMTTLPKTSPAPSGIRAPTPLISPSLYKTQSLQCTYVFFIFKLKKSCCKFDNICNNSQINFYLYSIITHNQGGFAVE